MPTYVWRADDGSEIERVMPMAAARPETIRRGGKTYTRAWFAPRFAVENVDVVSMSLPFLTDAQLADPKVPKAKNYTKDPITGLNHATFRSKRERSESVTRLGYVVD